MPWLVCCIIVRRDFIVHCTGLFHLLRFSSFKDTVQSSLFYLFTGRTNVFYTHLARLRSIFLLLEWKNVLCKPNVSFSVNRSLLMFLISFAFVRLNKYFKVMQYIFVNKKTWLHMLVDHNFIPSHWNLIFVPPLILSSELDFHLCVMA